VAAGYTSGPTDPSFVSTVAYTSGESQGKLQWSPVRPTKDQVGNRQRVSVAQRQLPPAAEPIPRGEPVDPFDDPFGDWTDLSQLAPPANLPGDRLIEGPEPQPSFQPSLPEMLQSQSSEQSHEIEVPSLEEALAGGPGLADGECPKVEDLKRIGEINYDIRVKGDAPIECGLGKAVYQPRAWAPTTFTWKASGLCHKPLYFQDVHLERYGHSWGPYLQPVFSGAHFFLSVPALPYSMGLYPPGECMYSLGYYRPGNCAPYLLDPLPLSLRAALTAGGVWTGLVLAIP